MSSIEILFDKKVQVKRLIPDESGDGESYGEYLNGVACHIQPVDEQVNEDVDGSFGKDLMMWCSVCDIKEHDKVVDGDDEYRVIGARSFRFMGKNQHMEIRLRWFQS
jgi:hypothetical protein